MRGERQRRRSENCKVPFVGEGKRRRGTQNEEWGGADVIAAGVFGPEGRRG